MFAFHAIWEYAFKNFKNLKTLVWKKDAHQFNLLTVILNYWRRFLILHFL